MDAIGIVNRKISDVIHRANIKRPEFCEICQPAPRIIRPRDMIFLATAVNIFHHPIENDVVSKRYTDARLRAISREHRVASQIVDLASYRSRASLGRGQTSTMVRTMRVTSGLSSLVDGVELVCWQINQATPESTFKVG